MNSKLKNLIKSIMIIILFVCAYLITDRILLLKSKEGIEQMEAYYKQEKDTVDVLFVGSSHIFCHVNTGILWDEYGISSFDLASAEQPFWISYSYIKEALKTQHPKLIVLDITIPGARPTDVLSENWMITSSYGLKPNNNRWDIINSNEDEETFKNLFIPMNAMHGRYNDLSKNDFVDEKNTINFKGFDPREGTTVFEEIPEVSDVTEREPISEKEKKYLRIIIEYLKEKDIPLLLIASPYVVDTVSQAKFNTIFDIADEYGVKYLDYNKLHIETELDFTKDMYEDLHLNRMGNAKFTSHLGDYLSKEYNLTDHRGDKLYSSWDSDANHQRQENARFYMPQITDSSTYWDLFLNNYGLTVSSKENTSKALSDPDAVHDTYISESGLLKYFYGNSDNYLIFLQVAPNIVSIYDDHHLRLTGIGLDENMLTPGGAYVFKSQECLFNSNDPEFKYSYRDETVNLLFRRKLSEETTEEGINLFDTVLNIDGTKFEMNKHDLSFIIYDTELHTIVDIFSLRPMDMHPIYR